MDRIYFFNRRTSRRRGTTLVELVIVAAILSVSLLLARVVVNLLSGLFLNASLVRTQQELQVTLYNITKEVRNCSDIVYASTGTLQLKVFNTRDGFRFADNPLLFNPDQLGTLTYQFVKEESGRNYLRKTLEFPGYAADEDRLLSDVLMEPDETNYLFNACEYVDIIAGMRCPPNGASPPYKAVDIRFSLRPLSVKGSSTTYTAQAMRRTKWTP